MLGSSFIEDQHDTPSVALAEKIVDGFRKHPGSRPISSTMMRSEVRPTLAHAGGAIEAEIGSWARRHGMSGAHFSPVFAEGAPCAAKTTKRCG